MSSADQYLNMLASDLELGFDVETNGLDWKTGFVCGYGLSDGRESVYVPVRHGGGENIENVDDFERKVAATIKERKKALIGQNIKFDMQFCGNHGITLGNNIVDTMVMGALLNENRYSYSLKNLCKEFPDIVQKNDKELYQHLSLLFGCKPTAKDSMGNFWRTAGDDPIPVEYAKDDNIAVKQLWDKQKRLLYAEQLDVVQELENNLTYVLQKMERKGIRINLAEVETLRKEIDVLHLEAYANIPLGVDLAPINVSSNKDLQTYFEYLEIEDWPVTEKGNPSFNKIYLSTLSEGEIILNARKLDTFINMFLEPLNLHVHEGRIHTRFNQAKGEFGGAKPGRLSSADPNMQQIPKRDKFIGKKFRKIFIADEGFVLCELDYSQAEPRLFTHYSDEPALLKGYNSTPFIDMHSIAVELMGEYERALKSGLHENEKDAFDAARNKCKNLNLGIMYTMGATKLALQLGISLEEAKWMVSQWYKAFPNVGSFTKKAAAVAESRGYVKTILGRRARFPDPRFAYRAANRIVQGGSADILKWKMCELNRWIEREGLDDVIQILLNIHDSLLIQVHKDHTYLIDDVKHIMENVQIAPFNLKVPFVVEYKPAGSNWSEATYG